MSSVDGVKMELDVVALLRYYLVSEGKEEDDEVSYSGDDEDQDGDKSSYY